MTAWKRVFPLMVSGIFAGCAGHAPEGLGLKEGRLAPCPSSPNCVSSQEEGSHAIAPLALPGDPDQGWAKLRTLVEARPDATVKAAEAGYLRVEFHTFLGFVDDAEFVLDRGALVVQVRSASRLGYSDFGKNRRRIEELPAALSKAAP